MKKSLPFKISLGVFIFVSVCVVRYLWLWGPEDIIDILGFRLWYYPYLYSPLTLLIASNDWVPGFDSGSSFWTGASALWTPFIVGLLYALPVYAIGKLTQFIKGKAEGKSSNVVR